VYMDFFVCQLFNDSCYFWHLVFGSLYLFNYGDIKSVFLSYLTFADSTFAEYFIVLS